MFSDKSEVQEDKKLNAAEEIEKKNFDVEANDELEYGSGNILLLAYQLKPDRR